MLDIWASSGTVRGVGDTDIQIDRQLGSLEKLRLKAESLDFGGDRIGIWRLARARLMGPRRSAKAALNHG